MIVPPLAIPADPRYPNEHRPLVTNQMKAACIGEFHMDVEETCPWCYAGGEENSDPDCECCGGKVIYTRQVQIPWDTIKRIYRAMVDAAKEPPC